MRAVFDLRAAQRDSTQGGGAAFPRVAGGGGGGGGVGGTGAVRDAMTAMYVTLLWVLQSGDSLETRR